MKYIKIGYLRTVNIVYISYVSTCNCDYQVLTRYYYTTTIY